jgi:hypothetical protein
MALRDQLQSWQSQCAQVAGELSVHMAAHQGMTPGRLLFLAARLHAMARTMELLANRWSVKSLQSGEKSN